jgi:hypothetical protein
VAIAFRGYNFGGGYTDPLTIVKPTGLAVGDLMLVHVRRIGYTTPTFPTGWSSANLIASVQNTYGMQTFAKIADATDVGQTSFSFTYGAVAYVAALMVAYSGVDATTPIQQVGTLYNVTATGLPINIPSITTSAENTHVVLFAGVYATAGKTFAVPTAPAFTERADGMVSLSRHPMAVADLLYAASGTVVGVKAYPVNANSTYLRIMY